MRAYVTALPGYWMNETGDELRPAVRAYLAGGSLDEAQIATLRAYFRQWINAPGFLGPDIAELRISIDGLTSRRAIAQWLELADAANVDPL